MTIQKPREQITCHHCGQKQNMNNAVSGRGNNAEMYCSYSCVKSEALNCNHSGVDVDYKSDGLMTAVCEYCGFELRAKEIDDEWLEESGEVIVIEWCLL